MDKKLISVSYKRSKSNQEIYAIEKYSDGSEEIKLIIDGIVDYILNGSDLSLGVING